MAAKLPVWGIDIGQCSLKALKLQAGPDKIETLAFDVVEHPMILSQDEAEAPAAIKTAIETFISRNDIRNSLFVVSVPGQQTLTRFTKMPPVEPKKIPDMVRYEAGQQIPFDMDEVVWDYQIFTEADSPDVEVGIFAIRRELIRNHLSQFTDSGIEPIIAQAGPMASYNAVRYDCPPTEGEAMILLDMGALATDLIVMEGNTIWSRPVPIGGNRFTEALVSAFKISFKKAEDLKRNAASTKYARQIFQAMRPVFADMVSEVQRSIGFYTSTHREANIKRVLGMGNAFKLPGLQKFLQQNLQIDVQKLSKFEKLDTAGHEKTSEFADNMMSFGVAYGLALQGLGLASVESSLLPPEIAKSLIWKKKRPWFGLSAACLALAAGSVWLSNSMAHGSLDEGMGGPNPPQPPKPPDVQSAMQVIESPPQGVATLKYVTTILGAAQMLKGELDKLPPVSGDQTAYLKKIAKLPMNNLVVPRIIDVIHRAFEDVNLKALRSIDSPDAYRAYARDHPRDERGEVWIQDVWMNFAPEDPASMLGVNRGRKRRSTGGWAIRVIGRTTRPNPAQWLDDNLIKALDTLGKQPDRGFYFHEFEEFGVVQVRAPRLSRAGPGRGGDDRRNQGFGRAGPRGDRGPGRLRPTAPTPKSRSIDEEIERLRGGDGLDLVTGEDVTGDRLFEIRFVAYKRKTPSKLIPARWKTKKEVGADDAGAPPSGRR
ncbi:MAG: type IV pilus assembly protein PilM [Planctomycetota bacterium]|nr:type IV pilus assembly protein PilM [Planctomycetota bacterium]